MTPTGSAQVRDLCGDRVTHCYVPYDLPDAVRRFLDRVRPEIAIVAETEFWPNIFGECGRRGIPLLLVNGARDTQVPVADLHLVASTLPGAPKDVWVNPNGRHMGSDPDWSTERIRTQVVNPWLVKQLKTDMREKRAAHQ